MKVMEPPRELLPQWNSEEFKATEPGKVAGSPRTPCKMPTPPTSLDSPFEDSCLDLEYELRSITPLESSGITGDVCTYRTAQNFSKTLHFNSEEPCSPRIDRESPFTRECPAQGFAAQPQPWPMSQCSTLGPAIKMRLASTALAFSNTQSVPVQSHAEPESEKARIQGVPAANGQTRKMTRSEHVRFDTSGLISSAPVEEIPAGSERSLSNKTEFSASGPVLRSRTAPGLNNNEQASSVLNREELSRQETLKPPNARSLSACGIPLMQVETVGNDVSGSTSNSSNWLSLQLSESDNKQRASQHSPSVPPLTTSRTVFGTPYNASLKGLASEPGSASLAPPVTRPVLNRYYSTPMDLMSPSRQHFRLHNPVPHHVKETPTIKFLEDARGKFINQYQITRVVGRGSFGMVYLAVDSEGQQYALKECSKRQLAKLNRSAFMRLRRQIVSRGNEPPTPGEISSLITREIAIMKKLDHPNLVTLYEVLDDPNSDSLILVLEWCPEGTIMPAEEEYDGKAKPISEQQSRLYFRDLILGVEYLHARGVCHRDIKADNVLLGEGDVVKIADFGVSEIFDLTKKEEDSVQRPVGSLAYMSPELVRLQYGSASDLPKLGSEANPDVHVPGVRSKLHPAHAPISGRKADIWAMGVTLYYMVHGRLPFEASSISGLHYSILTKEPDLSECSEDLADLLRRIFAKSPADRITLNQLREHSWVTQNSLDPLLPVEENVQVSENDKVTEEDMRTAVDRIVHRPGAPRLDYLTVVKSLRANHGWHGWNGSTDASESSSGSQTPQSIDPESGELSPFQAASDSSKMNKLSMALEELFQLQDGRC